MEVSRLNHYVPIWYQKRFIPSTQHTLHCLNFQPDKKILPDGRIIVLPNCNLASPKKCFFEKDLYTTNIFGFLNDEIEKYLFGKIDTTGSAAIRAFAGTDLNDIHDSFENFFEYLDAQKLRTPKGLDWIKTRYPRLNQLQLMLEMQQIRRLHCTMWVEAVREIVSAEKSDTKFIISDHPVTVYNPKCPPGSNLCTYPNDPPIALKGSQTIYPLDANHCLILTNLEYARDPGGVDPLSNRTNARNFGPTISRTDTVIRERYLASEEVASINFILKARARRFIGAAKKEWLFPESTITANWSALGKVLVPPKKELWHFGGEIFVGHKDGSVHYQDEFGRTSAAHPFLKKKPISGKVGRNDRCPCGSGKKYKKCCQGRPESDRPSSLEYSFRERNFMFFGAVSQILGLSKGKSWVDVRRDLTDGQVKEIHEVYGALWPADTNINDLLPKDDINVSRCLYTGLLDPRTIFRSAVCLTPYFDEILIVNPFTNPGGVNKKFSPTENPAQYRQDTIKNVLFLFEVMPFIEIGAMNLLPDPQVFSPPLRQQIMEMAKGRLKNWKPEEAHMEPMKGLMMEDFKRIMFGLPDDILKRQITEAIPGISNENIESTLEYIKRCREDDPLALLQPMLPTEGQGQMTISHVSPNLELGLFLAQLTGSMLLTDHSHRWAEISDSVTHDRGNNHSWALLCDAVSKLEFNLEANPLVNINLRRSPKIAQYRSVLRKALASAKQDSPTPKYLESLNIDIATAHAEAMGELANLKKELEGNDTVGPMAGFRGKINCLIPSGGIGRNTVQRLLVAFGSGDPLKSIHAAIQFIVEKEPSEIAGKK